MVIDEVETMYAPLLEPGYDSFEAMARAIIATCTAHQQNNDRRSRAIQLVINSRRGRCIAYASS